MYMCTFYDYTHIDLTTDVTSLSSPGSTSNGRTKGPYDTRFSTCTYIYIVYCMCKLHEAHYTAYTTFYTTTLDTHREMKMTQQASNLSVLAFFQLHIEPCEVFCVRRANQRVVDTLLDLLCALNACVYCGVLGLGEKRLYTIRCTVQYRTTL
jgi:hypothetical protein